MAEKEKPSPIEVFKEESDYLCGEIPIELVDGNPNFGKASVQLLKHHGTYQQDNRDNRAAARAEGKDKDYMFMVRTKVPGGRVTSDQLLAHLDLCDEVGNKTLRVTSRQGLQLHGVVKDSLAETIRRINECHTTTLGACGDVNRNVMCCPAPYRDAIHTRMRQACDELARHFAPRTGSYPKIWLKAGRDGEKQLVSGGENRVEHDGDDIEPIYGRLYLPRKFKIGVALPDDNCIDVYTHDLGFLAIPEGDTLKGYNVLVGGGQGVTPSAKKTFPALAKKMCFITPDQVIEVATAVVKVQRDFGNRSDRKVARLKYLIANWGIEQFKLKVQEYYGRELPAPLDADVQGHKEHMGWEEQGDGRCFYGLNVENGRILDNDRTKLKTALREICQTYQPGVSFTAHQSVLFSNIKPEDQAAFEAILARHNVPLSRDVSIVRRWSMACVAWPTCGLSITEAERALPGMVDQLEVELQKLGLQEEEFTLRMTGCPNGCARPYNPDIGLVGKAKGKYTILLGGRLLGNRLNFIYKDLVPAEDVVAELAKVFRYFKQDHEKGETFGDFCHRKGKADLIAGAEAAD